MSNQSYVTLELIVNNDQLDDNIHDLRDLQDRTENVLAHSTAQQALQTAGLSVDDIHVQSAHSDSYDRARRAVRTYKDFSGPVELTTNQRSNLLEHRDEWWVQNNWNPEMGALDSDTNREQWLKTLVNASNRDLLDRWCETVGRDLLLSGDRRALSLEETMAEVLDPNCNSAVELIAPPDGKDKRVHQMSAGAFRYQDSIDRIPEQPQVGSVVYDDGEKRSEMIHTVSVDLDPWDDPQKIQSYLQDCLPLDGYEEGTGLRFEFEKEGYGFLPPSDDVTEPFENGELTGRVSVTWTKIEPDPQQNEQSESDAANESSGLSR